MFKKICNFLFFRRKRLAMIQEKLAKCIMQMQEDCDDSDEFAEEFLKLLLNGMRLCFCLDDDYGRHIKGFTGRYLFRNPSGTITVTATFRNDDMKIRERIIDDADLIVNFRNGKALMDYILAAKPDILGSILRQDVVLDGNFSFLYKFAYMAKNLQFRLTECAA